ncbi:hypothetical protein [Microvirga guangxiensis]|uniref:DUF3800 domain-containing protein n=1 Tax=Microvirga guangxiensis TaxID=549386 RepID=A0A1G5F5Q5_9HYPH|nr:hypothetical protein [Microvirga guangxiensis]SCY34579.1 hypothetical protein SAMN02927923_01230 [Microvirga guangxiensis]
MTGLVADVVSFVDEAGGRGYLRNITEQADNYISLMCALPIPVEHLEFARESIRPSFDRFCKAAPPGAKLHITDAFQSGNDEWAKTAHEVREEIFGFMIRRQLRVVYAARRFKIAREVHGINEQLTASAKDQSPVHGPRMYAIPGANRPSDDQVEDQVLIDLALILDLFVEDAGFQKTDLYFDQIDAPVAKRYEELLERTKNISSRTTEVIARNLVTRTNETATISINANAGFRLDVSYVGDIVVVGKADPLIFAADIVANSLWRHFSKLPGDAPLNDGTGLKGWPLDEITFCDRRPGASLMDRI